MKQNPFSMFESVALSREKMKSIKGGTNPCVPQGCIGGEKCDVETEKDGGAIECQYKDNLGENAYCCKLVQGPASVQGPGKGVF